MKYLIILAGIAGIGLLQFTVLGHLQVFSIKPDLLLIAMILVSLYLRKWQGITLGVFCGALKDIFSISAFGINAVLFLFWSLLLGKVSRKISIDHNLVFAATVTIVTALNSMLVRLVFFYLGRPVSLGIFLRIFFLESLYTGLTALLFFRLVKWLESK